MVWKVTRPIRFLNRTDTCSLDNRILIHDYRSFHLVFRNHKIILVFIMIFGTLSIFAISVNVAFMKIDRWFFLELTFLRAAFVGLYKDFLLFDLLTVGEQIIFDGPFFRRLVLSMVTLNMRIALFDIARFSWLLFRFYIRKRIEQATLRHLQRLFRCRRLLHLFLFSFSLLLTRTLNLIGVFNRRQLLQISLLKDSLHAFLLAMIADVFFFVLLPNTLHRLKIFRFNPS